MRRGKKIILVGSWYVPELRGARRLAPRWVLGMRANYIEYSRGGNRHYACLESTFRRWMAKTLATRKYIKARPL